MSGSAFVDEPVIPADQCHAHTVVRPPPCAPGLRGPGFRGEPGLGVPGLSPSVITNAPRATAAHSFLNLGPSRATLGVLPAGGPVLVGRTIRMKPLTLSARSWPSFLSPPLGGLARSSPLGHKEGLFQTLEMWAGRAAGASWKWAGAPVSERPPLILADRRAKLPSLLLPAGSRRATMAQQAPHTSWATAGLPSPLRPHAWALECF